MAPPSVLVLAAGLGTRLRPLTDVTPKPLLLVGDRPALAHVLEAIAPVTSVGGHVVVNAFHGADAIEAFLVAHPSGAVVSREPSLLGTAGGLAFASSKLGDGDVLVWNGDILSSLDPVALLRAHSRGLDAIATLAVRALPAGEGNVGVDVRGRIVRLRHQSIGAEVAGGAFLGIHVVGAALRAGLPATGCLIGDVYLPLLQRGAALRAFDASGVDWCDIGTVTELADANRAWLRRRGLESFVSRAARVASGVFLQSTVVGQGAVVDGEGDVKACLILPGSRVRAPLASTVVAPHASVVIE